VKDKLIAAGVAACLAASACSGSARSASRSPAQTTTTALPSLTPRVTTGPAAARLAPGLLTTADVAGLPGAPVGLHVAPVNDARLFRDPDPRSPCGRRLAPPDPGSGAGVTIAAPGIGGFEFVFPVGVAEATAYVDATESDTRGGCPAYQTRANTGALQTVKLLTPVALSKGPDQQTAALLEIVPQGGQRTYAVEVAMRIGGVLAIEVMLDQSLPAPDLVRSLAAATAARLRSAPPG
jgi:hypothetical protein